MRIGDSDPQEALSQDHRLIEYVTLPNCPDCVRFERLWLQVALDFPHVESRAVPADSPRGHELSIGQGILRFPVIVLDGRVIGVESITADELRLSLAGSGGQANG